MVQLLVDPTLSPNGSPAFEAGEGPLVMRPGLGRTDSKGMSREEHALMIRELNMKRGLTRTPRRGWSMTDHQVESHGPHHFQPVPSHLDRQTSIPENAPLAMPIQPPSPEDPAKEQTSEAPRRPKLPPPRRSYSVMDYEPPPPGLPKPSERFTILDLPSELHYALFDFLDPIDSVCLGLTNSNLYAIHRRMHGTVPLSTRYSGPNDMEWAWRGAGPLVHPSQYAAAKENAMEQMRVKGQVYCRKCGISRCELHRHLKKWIGEGYEYCSVKDRFGKLAKEDAKPYCYMSSPKNPHRCGRHGSLKLSH